VQPAIGDAPFKKSTVPPGQFGEIGPTIAANVTGCASCWYPDSIHSVTDVSVAAVPRAGHNARNGRNSKTPTRAVDFLA
jgi:hypothetical protein